MTIVSDEQLAAFERRMQEKKAREEEERAKSAEKIANEISRAIEIECTQVRDREDNINFSVTSPVFPGMVEYGESKEETEADFREAVFVFVRDRVLEGRDPYTGEAVEMTESI